MSTSCCGSTEHETGADLKTIVREKYNQIALGQAQVEAETESCCSDQNSSNPKIYNMMMDDYSTLEGYVADADLKLGCGIPTEYAQITEGKTVLDLGSGAGNDAFVARHLVGENGQVFGVDFSPAMLDKARTNVQKLGFDNVQFLEGELEALPLEADSVDIIISNCVLNLVPNKPQVFAEMYRTLRPGGHFCVSDIVLQGNLPDSLKQDAEMYAGCVSGAIQQEAYLNGLEEAGFTDVRVVRTKAIVLPDELLDKHLNPIEMADFRTQGARIQSVTVFGKKG